MQTFIHEFPKTEVSPSYKALAVRRGFNAYPVVLFEGRQCYCFGSFRVGKGRNYHNRVQIQFIDNGEHRIVPGGEWAKKAKNIKLEG